MIGSVSIINPKLVTGPRSTSTIEIRAHTQMAMEKMLSTAVTALSVLNPHLRIRDERKKRDSKKRNRGKKLILPKNVDPIAPLVSDITGIRGKYKLADPIAFKIEPFRDPTKNAPLGAIDSPTKAQNNVMRMLRHVNEGRNIDLLA